MKNAKNQAAIIIGAGRFGIGIADTLSDQGYRICMIDCDSSALRKLPTSFRGNVLIGNGADIDVLRDANIDKSMMVVAATQQDNTNCLIAEIASSIFHVPNVYVRLDDPSKEHLLEEFDVKPIYPYRLSAGEFEKLSACTAQEGMTV